MATNAEGESSAGEEAAATTAPDRPAAPLPPFLTANGPTEIQLSWAAPKVTYKSAHYGKRLPNNLLPLRMVNMHSHFLGRAEGPRGRDQRVPPRAPGAHF